MKWMFWLSTCCVMFVCAACTPSEPVQAPQKRPEFVSENQAEKPMAAKPLFSKEVKEGLYFAASLERESLRLISHNPSLEPTTLFSVLSYAFEVSAGTKRVSPRNVDCGRYQIEKSAHGSLDVFKICQKPFTLIANVHPKMNESEVDVTFKIKEWASVVGLSVTLTNPDVTCSLRLKDKKLKEMSCKNWSYFLSGSDASSTEIHLKTMSFHRDQVQQLKLSGGFFRDLVERKKIDITVPLEGKIKLIEKEIEVKDDFADKLKTSEEARGEKEKGKEVDKENNSEKEDYQRWIKEGHQSESQSGDESQSENQNQSQSQSQSESQNQVQPNEVLEGESSGGVPQQPQPRNRGR